MTAIEVRRSTDELTLVPLEPMTPSEPGGLELSAAVGDASGVRSVVIDLAGVDRINLVGVGELVGLYLMLQRQGIRLSVKNARDGVEQRLVRAGVSTLLRPA